MGGCGLGEGVVGGCSWGVGSDELERKKLANIIKEETLLLHQILLILILLLLLLLLLPGLGKAGLALTKDREASLQLHAQSTPWTFNSTADRSDPS